MSKTQNTEGEVLERIEQQRVKLGSTKTHLIKSAGISPSTYYRNMRGEGHFDLAQLIAIARALGVNLSDLITPNGADKEQAA